MFTLSLISCVSLDKLLMSLSLNVFIYQISVVCTLDAFNAHNDSYMCFHSSLNEFPVKLYFAYIALNILCIAVYIVSV